MTHTDANHSEAEALLAIEMPDVRHIVERNRANSGSGWREDLDQLMAILHSATSMEADVILAFGEIKGDHDFWLARELCVLPVLPIAREAFWTNLKLNGERDGKVLMAAIATLGKVESDVKVAKAIVRVAENPFEREEVRNAAAAAARKIAARSSSLHLEEINRMLRGSIGREFPDKSFVKGFRRPSPQNGSGKAPLPAK